MKVNKSLTVQRIELSNSLRTAYMVPDRRSTIFAVRRMNRRIEAHPKEDNRNFFVTHHTLVHPTAS